MSRLGSALSRAVGVLVRGFDEVFRYGGEDIKCVPNTQTTSRPLGMGGLGFDADLVLQVSVSDIPLTVTIREKKNLEYKGRTWRIDSIKNWPGGTVIALLCNDPRKNV